MKDQVEDAKMGTFMVEAMEGAGRGMAPAHLNGRHNSNIVKEITDVGLMICTWTQKFVALWLLVENLR